MEVPSATGLSAALAAHPLFAGCSALERARLLMEQGGGGKAIMDAIRLLDAQNILLEEATLMSFTAGFKLAWGMAKELEADGLYSFEREEEERICHPAEQNV